MHLELITFCLLGNLNRKGFIYPGIIDCLLFAINVPLKNCTIKLRKGKSLLIPFANIYFLLK